MDYKELREKTKPPISKQKFQGLPSLKKKTKIPFWWGWKTA